MTESSDLFAGLSPARQLQQKRLEEDMPRLRSELLTKRQKARTRRKVAARGGLTLFVLAPLALGLHLASSSDLDSFLIRPESLASGEGNGSPAHEPALTPLVPRESQGIQTKPSEVPEARSRLDETHALSGQNASSPPKALDQTAPPHSDDTSGAPGARAALENRWRASAGAGEYQKAFEQAEQIGFSSLCSSLNLDDLFLLAESARFAGHAGESALALKAVRSRFRGEARASIATFSLARLAADVMHDDKQAAFYFSAYLQELPNGPLASIATGRLIESLLNTGDRTRAMQVAQSYTTRYPEGAHIHLARSLLEKSTNR